MQLLASLRNSIAFEDFQLLHSYSGSNQCPKPADIAHIIRQIPESAMIVLSSDKGIFGVYIPLSSDASAIRLSDWSGMRSSLFQLAPLSDWFQGIEGKAAWTLESEQIMKFGEENAGVSLILGEKDGHLNASFRHDVLLGIYESNPFRGKWEVSFDVQMMEIWHESLEGRSVHEEMK